MNIPNKIKGCNFLNTKKPLGLSLSGVFEDQSQVFPSFHCGGSQLLTKYKLIKMKA
tara:strand:+ start:119 stop:286 length:168 start_codon:yes stop_codon:yes gene_type:complete